MAADKEMNNSSTPSALRRRKYLMRETTRAAGGQRRVGEPARGAAAMCGTCGLSAWYSGTSPHAIYRLVVRSSTRSGPPQPRSSDVARGRRHGSSGLPEARRMAAVVDQQVRDNAAVVHVPVEIAQGLLGDCCVDVDGSLGRVWWYSLRFSKPSWAKEDRTGQAISREAKLENAVPWRCPTKPERRAVEPQKAPKQYVSCSVTTRP
ncbi:uncharacterized protein B0T15DRAFT_544450 [Chaetomium strumarium]|uniref:Uncharacterized protein n=1 Tax=Chaetomium strumarium TaxID=1170767 RepID=A0AAJ0GKT1_9PEZI|nr:hypothetical protein B0T15DRAFT_544450 [Chaetomium strumarium]